MAITFDHAVKYHGKYYPPNTPIEEPETVPVEATNAEADQAAQNAAQEPAAAVDEANTNEEQEAPKKAAKSRKKGDA